MGFVAAPSEWSTVDPTSGNAGKEPLKNTVNVNLERFTKEARDVASQYNKLAFDYYDKLRNSRDPDEAKYGAEQLKNIFGNYIDASYTLKDFNANPAFGIEGSPDSWKAIYSRASSALKGDKHIMSAADELSMATFEQMDKTISRKLQAQESISKLSLGYNKDSATWLKNYGASEYRGEADILFDKDGRERTKAQFMKDFKGRHFRQEDPLAGADASEIYDELSEEFLDIYNRKLPPSMRTNDTSVFKGGGIGDIPVMAKFDAANINLSDRTDLLSLKDDIYRKGAFVMLGPNQAGEKGKLYSEANNSPAAQQLMAAILDASTRGGWDPKTESGKKRPIFTVTAHGVALNTPGLQAYSLSIDPFFAEQLRGSKEKAGLAKNLFGPDGALITKELTLYIPDEVAQNEYSKRGALSDYDAILQTQGKYTIDDYSNGGGTVEVSRAPDGSLSAIPTLQRVQKDGTFTSDVFQRIYPPDPLTPSDVFIEGQALWLKQIQQKNLEYREELLKILPKERSLGQPTQ